MSKVGIFSNRVARDSDSRVDDSTDVLSSDIGALGAEAKGPSPKLIFGIISVALLMASIDSTIVATALPRIDHSLHSPINWASWSITVYQLGMVVGLPLAGKISDQYGRKKVFLLAAVIFTVASLLCGLSTSIYMLVGLRFVQSLGGAAFLPSASGIVSDHFGKDRDRALGLFTAILPMGMIAGPIFGGVISQDWSWRGIFFLNIPLGSVLIVLGLRFLPNAIPKGVQSIDLRGAALLAATVVTAMLGITAIGGQSIFGGSAALNIVLPLLVSFGAGYAFLLHIKRAPNPFISYRLLFGKGFGAMNLINFFYGTALGFGVLVPLYAVNRYHIGLTSSGTLLSARAVGMVSVSTLSTFMLRRTGYRKPMIFGLLLVVIGLILLAVKAPAGVSPYLWVGGFSALTGIGFGSSAPAANNATMQLAPEHVASIAGQRGMFRQVGSIFYISIASSFIARDHLHPALTQARTLLVLGIVLFLSIGLVFRIPDHKGSW
jgi:MFS family permease